MSRHLVLALAGLVGGCDRLEQARAPGAPVVRASDGAFASVTIIACPPTELRALAVGELIQILTQHDELAIARAGGTARLVINACPFPSVTGPEAMARRR